ncbi:hypothetical protein Tco_0575738 [Tanacetum coccineum]
MVAAKRWWWCVAMASAAVDGGDGGDGGVVKRMVTMMVAHGDDGGGCDSDNDRGGLGYGRRGGDGVVYGIGRVSGSSSQELLVVESYKLSPSPSTSL